MARTTPALVLALALAGLSGETAIPTRAGDAASPETCELEEGPSGVVAAVIDGETIRLEDGSEVRLIGALAPRARDADVAAGSWSPEREATQALSDLVIGKTVKLAFGGRRTDRYGRTLAHVYVVHGVAGEWVQGALLDAGHARAYGLTESFVCARELLAHEALARAAKLGIWANAIYGPKPAERPGYLMSLRGKYERVIGKIENVGVTKGATYLNFGADWHDDFTIRIDKKVLSAHPDLAARVAGLKGVHITVRGWIERRDGPSIELADPSQLEILDEPPPDAAIAGSARGGGVTEPANASPPPDAPSREPPEEQRVAPPAKPGDASPDVKL